MGRPLYTNNAATYLAFGITNTATTMQVSANAGGLFPNPVGGDYFYVSLISLSGPIIEIVKCTARNGDIFTIERGQEGTSPLYWNTGDNVQLRITAAGMNFISGASATTTEEETQTATQGQTLFTLNTIDYTPNTNNLAVFVNGSKQVSGVNFTETSLNTVTFTSGLNAGDVVEFIYGLTIASGTLYATDIKYNAGPNSLLPSGTVETALNSLSDKTTGANYVGYNEGGTGAINRTVTSKLQDIVSVKDFGATGDGATDDTAAIQAAINAATAIGKSVFFPAGTYMVNINTTITLEGGTTYCSLVAVSGMQLIGEGWNLSTIKLLNNQSSNASPKKFNIIAGNTVMSNILIQGLGFDINGANNKINGVVNGGVGYTCAAFICSGSVATVGVDARLINAKFKDLYIANTPGTTCIGTGQSNSNGYTLGQNIEISGCIFNNNGLDTLDHSSIFAFSENVDIHDNIFTADSMATLVVGGRFACELHGARNLFHNNDVYNYNSGVYVSVNQTRQSSSQSVSDNTFYTANTAVQAAGGATSSLPGISDVIVNNNRILMSNDNPITSFYKYAIDMSTQYGNISNCIISDNLISTIDTYGAVGIRVGSQTTGYPLYGISISNNLISGFSIGISLGLTSGGTIAELDVKGNSIVNVVTDTLTPTYTQGISVNGPITQLNISNNSVFSRAGQLYYGVNIPNQTGVSVSNLYMESNDIDANATSAIYIGANISGRRSGIQAVTFAALPTTSTWKVGDVAYNSLPSVSGSSGSQYVITGWSRLTNGTGNTLNTDWVQNRTLTGT